MDRRARHASDLREKLLAYREIPTLEDYLPIERDTVGLILFTRKAAWQPHPLGVEDTLHLASVGLTIPVLDVYGGVRLGSMRSPDRDS